MTEAKSTLTTLVGVNDINPLLAVAREHFDYEHTDLAVVSTRLAALIDLQGLKSATEVSEPVIFLELDRDQRHVLSEAHELRQYGQFFATRS